MSCMHLKRIYTVIVGRNMSISSNWLIVLFKFSIILLIFCLYSLSGFEKGVLKSLTITVDLFISSWNSPSFSSYILKFSFYKNLELLCSLDKFIPFYFEITFFISGIIYCSEVYLVLHENSYSSFLSISVRIVYFSIIIF